MYLLFGFALIFPSTVLGQSVNNVNLQKGMAYEISNPQYPGDTRWEKFSLEWNLDAGQNGRIKIVCSDIRMVQRDPWTEDCPHVFLSVTDGKGERKVCGSGIYDFAHVSDGTNLIVKAGSPAGEGNALISCTALNIGEPEPEELVQLEPNGRAWRLNLYEETEPKPYSDRLWKFESPEGTRISFQCDTSLPNLGPMCGFSVLTINDGVNDEEFCAAGRYVRFSKINKSTLRFQQDGRGKGKMECLVQAVTGPNANEYENVVSAEVDSSEHGVTPGSRKTSCKCGWANKNVARIINGTETRVNEFPWMVYLSVKFETDQNSWMSSCGGSLITPRHVLTAAHCVVTASKVEKPENVAVILGKHDSTKPTGKEVVSYAEKIFVPKLYLEKGLYFHDFAMIFTKQTIEFNHIIGPICIEPTALPVTNRRAIIMGWGLTEEYRPSDYLRKAKVRVMNTAVCGGSAWDVCTVSEPRNFCSGDSGGPVVWLDKDTNRFSQISIISRVPSQCRGNTASYSTQVAFFYDYIQQVIQETDPSVATCHKL